MMSGDINLYHGDCLDVLHAIPNASVDMVLADLPYGTTDCAWDIALPLDILFPLLWRVSRANAALVFFSQQPFTTDLICAARKEFRYDLVWRKSKATGYLNANRMPLKKHESILVFYRRLPTFHPIFTSGRPYRKHRSERDDVTFYSKHANQNVEYEGKRYPVSVLDFFSPQESKSITTKPVDLLEYLIRTYTNEGETVLDPTMGSGSCGVACRNTGRQFIGIEKDPHFFQIAQNRIATG